jgi:quercetin dioxygenase-like cupin family protein
VIELQAGDVLPLERASGVRLTALEGSLWLTEEGEPGDVVLQPGQSFAVEAKGRALVQALSRSRLAIEAANKRALVGFGSVYQDRLAA